MAKDILSKKELDHLAQVIGEVEKNTSGELRLMLVKRSVRASYVGAALWLFLTVLSLLGLWYQRHSLWFSDMPVLIDDPWWFVPSILLATAVLAWFLARVETVARLFIPLADMKQAVWTRAELEFYREGLQHTNGGTGILLFVSRFEREAIVLADKSIASRLKPETWNEVVKLIVQGARSGQWAPKLEQAIRLCGNLLAEHFPIQPDDKNELPNSVILKD